MPFNKNLLLIYTKRPSDKGVKTRIAAETSRRFSSSLASAMLRDLVRNLRSKKYDLLFGVDSKADSLWFKKKFGISSLVFPKNSQNYSQIGMSTQFSWFFSKAVFVSLKYEKAVLIPMDLPYLKESRILNAFAKLSSTPYVFGPEQNGGVYLIGLRAGVPSNIFDGVGWGEETSFSELLANVPRKQAHVLPMEGDINTLTDLLSLNKRLKRNAPTVHKTLNDFLINS